MAQKALSNQEYLDRFSDGLMAADTVLLPHEQALVEDALAAHYADKDKITEEKISVSGGDDWHDGAFRETDRAAMAASANMRALAPYIGATLVSYPHKKETRASLGSRVQVAQKGYVFYVDIIGFLSGYPHTMKDPETNDDIDGTSPQMPLGAALMGKRVCEPVSFKHDSRTIEMSVQAIDQEAIQSWFTRSIGVSIGEEET